MAAKKQYKVLIVEDDPTYAEPLQEHIRQSDDFKVMAVTASVEHAIKLVKINLPDVVIIDLQLTEGDGLDLIHRLRDPDALLPIVPYLLVTTSFTSNLIRDRLSDGLADYIFKKQNNSYSPAAVLNHLRLMARHFHRNRKPDMSLDDETDKAERLRARIDSELSRYYMSTSSIARTLLVELIYRATLNPLLDLIAIGTLYTEVGKQFEKTPKNVDVSVSRLIDIAFTKTDPVDLTRAYQPYLDIGRCSPTNKEFILYIVEKLRREGFV